MTVADAMEALWQDLRNSLCSRIRLQGEMIAAVACGSRNNNDGTADSANIGAVVFAEPTALPRRVLINTSMAVPGLDCCYADYLYPDGAASRCHRVLML